MANSKLPGLLGIPGPYPAARTPGVLGFNDQGDPTKLTLLGDTPGPLGFNDYGDPNLKLWSRGSGFNFAQSVRTDIGVALALPVGGAMPLVDDALGRLITAAQLLKIFGAANADYLKRLAEELNTDLIKICLNTTLRKAHFFSQVREESGADSMATVENLMYRQEVLIKKFPYYEEKPGEALLDGYKRDPVTKKITHAANPEAIANKIYGSKYDNTASGDGWRYRGRGAIQITFKSNYRETTVTYQKLYNDLNIDFVRDPDLMSEFPYSIRSAICFWINKKIFVLADQGGNPENVDRVTNIVNKRTDSRIARKNHFIKAINAFQ